MANSSLIKIVKVGFRGPSGSGAYTTWLAIGNEGTEEEFLESLKGPSIEVAEFSTDAEALAYSIANPTAFVISTEGL